MLRNRSSFFQESSMNSSMYQGVPNYQYMAQGGPIMAGQSNQSYYSGPVPNNNYDDYDSRIAKLERQINRLDARITKLENANKLESIDMSSNMYMV